MIGSYPKLAYILPLLSLAHSGRSTRNKKRKKAAAAVAEAGAKPKRAQTGYTLYVQENYESIKRANAAAVPGDGMPQQSREILSTLARHWGQVDDEEKREWQDKADQLKQEAAANGNRNGISGMERSESTEEIGQPKLAEDWGSKKRAARKPPPDANAKEVSAQMQV